MTFRMIVTMPDGSPLVYTVNAEEAAVLIEAAAQRVCAQVNVGDDKEADYLNFAAIPRVQFQVAPDADLADFTDAIGSSQPHATTGTTETPDTPAPTPDEQRAGLRIDRNQYGDPLRS